MIINVQTLINKLNEYKKETGTPFFHGSVNYTDKSINDINRINAFNTNDLSLYFEKDNFFSYQNEFRIFFPELVSDKPEIINIGDLSKGTVILKTEDFLKYHFQISMNLYEK